MSENNKDIDCFSTHGVENFKAFTELQNIELAPITLIYGQNSGGKSSFIQSILCLSQSKSDIGNGEVKFSGENTEAGTYESIFNKAGNQNKNIVFEVANNITSSDKTKKDKPGFYIDAFDAINDYKIKYFISPSEDPSKGVIDKLEITFTKYLSDLPLIFSKDKNVIYQPAETEKENYKLEDESIKNLKIIYERIFEKVESRFQEIIKNQKGLLKSAPIELEGIYSEEGSNITANFPFQILTFLRFAALKISMWVDVIDNKIFLYSLKPKSNSKLSNQIKIIQQLTKDIFEVFYKDFSTKKVEFFVFIKNKSNLTESKKVLEVNRFNKRNNLDLMKAVDAGNIKTDDQELNFWLKSKIHNQFDSKRDIYINQLIDVETDTKKTRINSYLSLYKEKSVYLSKEAIKLRKAAIKISKKLEDLSSLKLTPLSESIKNDILKINTKLFTKYLNNIEYYVKEIFESSQKLFNFENYIIYKLLDVLRRTMELISMDVDRCRYLFKNEEANESVPPEFLVLLYLRYNLTTLINTTSFLETKLLEVTRFCIISEIFKVRDVKDISKKITKNSLLFLFEIDKTSYSTTNSRLLSENISDSDYDISLFYHRGLFNIFERGIHRAYRPQLRSTVDFINNFEFSFHRYLPFFFIKNLCLPKQITKKIIHLGPARPGAKRFYTSKDIENLEPNDVAYLLKSVSHNFDIESQLKKILISSKILSSIETKSFDDKTIDAKKIEVTTIGSKAPVNIADTGYGISQILPIIYSAITYEPNTIVVQQPETHLHPRLQAEVGSIICNSINNRIDKNWIIETHSEILLLRILKLIRKGIFNSNLLRIYYIDKVSNGGAVIKRMYISEKGSLITQWPEGFFSEDIDEIFDN